MRQLLMTAATVGAMSLTLGGTAAFAGYCGSGPQSTTCMRPAPPMMAPPCGTMAAPALNCQTPVFVKPGAPYQLDPVVVTSTQPMGYLRSVKLHNSPHVNIMRVHGQSSGVGLKDAPTGFTGGCHPSSTTYCGQQTAAASPPPVIASRPAPRPYIAPPLPAPVVMPNPVQYGSTELVRGTAYLPTSHVNRDYQTAVNVLNAGPIPARPAVNGGEVPHPSMFAGVPGYNRHAGMNPPVFRPAPFSAPAPSAPPPSAMGPGPGHWEQVSGPTMVGGLQATQVVCRRAAPMPAPPTCVQQVMSAPLELAGQPRVRTQNSRYGSGH